MLHRVADILQDHLEEIVRAWVADLRQTSQTEVHDEMLSAQIVDGMKAMISNVADTIEQGIGTDEAMAQAAGAAELFSGRTVLDESPLAPAVAQPLPVTLPPQAPPSGQAAHSRQPDARHRRFYRAQLPRGARRPVADPTMQAESLRRALDVAEHSGRLRQQQGYEINEVVQEYLFLRRRFWQTLGHKLRRNDRAAVELAIYIDGLLDNLLIATVQSYQDATLQELKRQAVRDPLTGLFNHSYCWERIHEEARRYRRYNTPFSVVLVDLDHLKRINDTYGHQMGDRVLRHVAESMHLVARSTDILCRYAGDEFVLILPGEEKHEAQILAERLRVCVRRSVLMVEGLQASSPPTEVVPPSTILPTISLGLASCPADARIAETLIAQADSVLYRAKAAGRDAIG